MVAGGGASVIYSDTICDLGGSKDLANYGEYSGAPNEGESVCVCVEVSSWKSMLKLVLITYFLKSDCLVQTQSFFLILDPT